MFDAEAGQPRHALRSAGRAGVARGHSKSLRTRVVAYAQRAVAAGRTRAPIADALGLSPVTLTRRGQPSRTAAPGFRPVVVGVLVWYTLQRVLKDLRS